MKVLQLTTRHNTFFKQQINILEEMGMDCEVIVGNKFSSAELSQNKRRRLIKPGHNLPYYLYCAGRFYPNILKETIFSDYDIIHANSGLTAPFGLLQAQRPIVLTLWGSALMGNYLYGSYNKVCRFCANRYDAVIVRNNEMASMLDNEACVIPSGVDLDQFRPIPKEDAYKKVGWDSNRKHILFPYSPERKTQKNYHLAEKVVSELNQRGLPISLQTVFSQPHEIMPYYINASDVLLLTSRVEGSPNTVKEAMACNLPVVSTDVGDVRERLGPVENSYVCDHDEELVDAVIEVLESGERSNGREFVDEVSLERMGERIIDVYESVL